MSCMTLGSKPLSRSAAKTD